MVRRERPGVNAGWSRLRHRKLAVFVSVIVPMYNAERTLAACLDGLTAQDHPRDAHEILLVDNGSTDASASIARRYPGITLLAEPRPGAYAARNHGLRQARGDVIAFTDPDCVPDPSWIRAIALAFEDPGLELLCGRRRPGRRSVVLASIADYENTKDGFVLDGGDEELYYGYSSNMGVRASLFGRLGPFLERPRGADTLFVRKVARERSCAAIRYLADAVVTHLELDGLSTYYKKVFLYGRHRRRNNPILRTRPLAFAERMAVFRTTVKAGRYSLARSAALLGALGIGSLAWLLGSASGVVAGGTGSGAAARG
jgi:glycosyltransferase involved in cell wall biosynthesis